MPEEIKERLSKTEEKRMGDVLLELVGACPYIPAGTKVKYNSMEVGKCVVIWTVGGEIKKRNVLGGFTAELTIQILYQSFPTTNSQMINAQAVVDNITGWLEDIQNLPRLTGNRTITKITAGGSFPDVEEVEGDKSTVFAANVVMEYKKEELW